MSNNVNFLKIFNGNMSTALRQSATLAKPKNWKERFNNRTALGKTLSFARYGAVVAIAGLATDSFLENDITSNNAAAYGLGALGLITFFALQRIEDIKVEKQDGEINEFEESMDRMNAMDFVYSSMVGVAAYLLDQPGFFAMAMTFGAQAAIMASLPNTKEWESTRSRIANFSVAAATVLISYAASTQETIYDIALQASPIIPMALGTIGGSKINEKAKLGRAFHLAANTANFISTSMMGLYHVTIVNSLGVGNGLTTIENRDMPIQDKNFNILSTKERISAWFNIIGDNSKINDYIYKSDRSNIPNLKDKYMGCPEFS